MALSALLGLLSTEIEKTLEPVDEVAVVVLPDEELRDVVDWLLDDEDAKPPEVAALLSTT